jgi:hypothetical protein
MVRDLAEDFGIRLSCIWKNFLLTRAFGNLGGFEDLGNFHTILSYFSPSSLHLVSLFHLDSRVTMGMEPSCLNLLLQGVHS